MIAIINYQMGNLQSIVNAFEALGQEITVVDKPEQLKAADGIVIPGVGAFGQGMENLRKMNLIEALNEEVMAKKKPFLGICLGMQLIARKSFEHGEHKGLGWVDFTVKKILPENETFRIPHMGWNNLENINKESRMFKGVKEPAVVYFVHSYNLEPEEGAEGEITSTCYHGKNITASVEKGNVFGLQFHPEKSQNTGLMLLKNFSDITNRNYA